MLRNHTPPVDASRSYAIRFSHTHHQLNDVLLAWVPLCDAIVAYEHIHQSRIHLHFAVLNSKRCSKQLRNIAAKIIGPDACKGNENLSIKKWNGSPRYITYCSRGELDPVDFYEFNEDWLDYAKSLYVEGAEAVLPIEQSYNEWSHHESFFKPIPPIFNELGEVINQALSITQDQVLKRARQFAASKHKGFMPVQANNLALSLYRSYCVRNGIEYSR